MLIAQRQRIVKVDLTDTAFTLNPLPLIKSGDMGRQAANVIAMDLDYSTDCVFWADISLDKIMKQCLDNSSRPEVRINTVINLSRASIKVNPINQSGAGGHQP